MKCEICGYWYNTKKNDGCPMCKYEAELKKKFSEPELFSSPEGIDKFNEYFGKPVSDTHS